MYILSRTVSKLLQIIGQICAFGAPFGGLGATYDVHLRLIGKLDFLLVIIELFSLGAFVLSQCTCLTDGRTDIQMLIGRPRLHSCIAVKMMQINVIPVSRISTFDHF